MIFCQTLCFTAANSASKRARLRTMALIFRTQHGCLSQKNIEISARHIFSSEAFRVQVGELFFDLAHDSMFGQVNAGSTDVQD